MKRILKLAFLSVLLICLLVLSVACNNNMDDNPDKVANTAPTASFNLSGNDVDVEEIITFTDTSTDSDGTIEALLWSFGDGEASTALPKATHWYTEGGTYTVTLTAIDDDGATASATQTVTVNGAPAASFTVSPSTTVTTGDSIDLDATASSDDGSIVSYSWDTGDGSAALTTSTATCSYSSTGQYWITLTVTDDTGLTGQAQQRITVNDTGNNAPVADAGEDQEIDADTDGTTVTLDGSGSSDAEGIASYSWAFVSLPDNSSITDSDITDSTTSAPSFDVSGETGDCNQYGEYVYVLELTVTDTDSAVSTDTVTITVTGTSSVVISVE